MKSVPPPHHSGHDKMESFYQIELIKTFLLFKVGKGREQKGPGKTIETKKSKNLTRTGFCSDRMKADCQSEEGSSVYIDSWRIHISDNGVH